MYASGFCIGQPFRQAGIQLSFLRWCQFIRCCTRDDVGGLENDLAATAGDLDVVALSQANLFPHLVGNSQLAFFLEFYNRGYKREVKINGRKVRHLWEG